MKYFCYGTCRTGAAGRRRNEPPIERFPENRCQQAKQFKFAAALAVFLVRMTDECWQFLWSVPDIVLDGWSWPVIFAEVSEIDPG